MDFRITGLPAEPFQDLFGLSEADLLARGVRRYRVDKTPAFPDRIEMRDAQIGETVLLLNHVCQPADTPYRATHAIFVREGATRAYDALNEMPEVMRTRLLSLRAFDGEGMMHDADVVQGAEAIPTIQRLLEDPRVSYIHAHYAKRGCYAGRIDRA